MLTSLPRVLHLSTYAFAKFQCHLKSFLLPNYPCPVNVLLVFCCFLSKVSESLPSFPFLSQYLFKETKNIKLEHCPIFENCPLCSQSNEHSLTKYFHHKDASSCRVTYFNIFIGSRQ